MKKRDEQTDRGVAAALPPELAASPRSVAISAKPLARGGVRVWTNRTARARRNCRCFPHLKVFLASGNKRSSCLEKSNGLRPTQLSGRIERPAHVTAVSASLTSRFFLGHKRLRSDSFCVNQQFCSRNKCLEKQVFAEMLLTKIFHPPEICVPIHSGT